MKRIIYYFLVIAACSTSCSMTNRTEAGEVGGSDNQKPSQEDFREFYQRFVNDSAFQKSRLLFPLEGEKIVDEQAHSWTPGNWTLIRASVYEIDTTEYKVEIEDQETLKSFRIYIPDSGFELLIKFKIVSGKWYLFYCKDMFS
jgi:hypothetical protein